MYQTSNLHFKLEYSSIRDELIQVFQQIANAETQRQEWTNQESLPPMDTDRLSALLQFVYTATGLATEPDFTIGLFLKDAVEAQSAWTVFCAVEQVFQAAGIDATCNAYIACPEWSNLVQTVNRALQIIQKNHSFSELVN